MTKNDTGNDEDESTFNQVLELKGEIIVKGPSWGRDD